MARTRSEWNSRFEYWERPASDSEEAIIERAAAMVRGALDDSEWLDAEGVMVHPQGSYHNNTNVRLESDMDLRVMHPAIKVEYDPNVHRPSANATLFTYSGRSLEDLAARMRAEMVQTLGWAFGASNVDASGGRAVHVKGLPGGRAEADVVPAFVLNYVSWNAANNRYDTLEGIAIPSKTDPGYTFNFPDQHHQNGISKRALTRLRFKRNVRIMKRLRNELADLGHAPSKSVPSFLVECLVHGVEDEFFLVEADDRYDRARRILYRLEVQLGDPTWVAKALEINGIKRLFGTWQKWKPEDSAAFVGTARAHLEA